MPRDALPATLERAYGTNHPRSFNGRVTLKITKMVSSRSALVLLATVNSVECLIFARRQSAPGALNAVLTAPRKDNAWCVFLIEAILRLPAERPAKMQPI